MAQPSRVAVVSGAGTGIGAAAAAALAGSCSRLVLVGRRADRLDAVAAGLATIRPAPQVDCRSVDLTEVPSVGALDIIVSNAGSPQARMGDSLASIAEVWESTWRANTLSAVLLVESLKALLPRPGGRIVIVGSAAGSFGTGSPAYAAAKGAQETYALSLMRELCPDGVTANVVAPGYTDGTELVAGRISPERRERLLAGIAARRPATMGPSGSADGCIGAGTPGGYICYYSASPETRDPAADH